MQQLSSIDASFIEAETPNLPMHASSVSIYDPSTAPGEAVRFRDIVQLYEQAMYDIPMLRRRLVQVPGNMDFPYWIEDPDLDIEFHVRHVALPRPGDWRQFYIQLARLHSRGLDLQRSPWEIYVIDGLNDLDGIPAGSFAVMQKLHHAAADGDSVQHMQSILHELEPGAPRSPRQTEPLIRESRPGTLPLLLKSWQRSVGRPARLGRAVVKTISGARRVNEARERGELEDELKTTWSRFNGDISPHRVVTAAGMDLEELKQLRLAAPGATLNDLAISIVAGALRLYLADKGDSLEQPLVTQVPVNIRTAEQKSKQGNKITRVSVSSCSNIADPLARLEAIHRSSESGKKLLDLQGNSMNEEMADALGPHVTRTIFRLMDNSGKIQALTHLMPAGPNFSLSNMPGPPQPMYLCGAELVWGIGLAPLLPNMGLSIIVSSGNGKCLFGVTACRRMLPDPEFFQQCLYRSYEECRETLRGPARRNAPGRQRAKR
jgi:WS/DGAT/MGAT family acyltransferase